MFDLAWSEIALIAIVALVVIGPKDLPGAIRGIAEGIKKLRRMAGEFQQQADELVKEAKLDELRNQIQDVRSTISDIRNFDLKGEFEKTIDKDGTLRQGLSDPMTPSWTPPVSDGSGVTSPSPTSAEPEEAPAFVPPSVANTYRPPPPPPPQAEAPDFVPPSYAPPPPPTPVVSAPPPAPSVPMPAPAVAEAARPIPPSA